MSTFEFREALEPPPLVANIVIFPSNYRRVFKSVQPRFDLLTSLA
jgi:hypothetical protein